MKKTFFIILTLFLICLVIFFYWKDLNTEDIKLNQNVNKNSDNISETVDQVNGSFQDLINVTKLSNLIKQEKQEILFKDLDSLYNYDNSELGFGINLDKTIFSQDKDKSFQLQDKDNLILVFMGKYINLNVNIALLVNKDINNCKINNASEIVIDDNIFLCSKILIDNQKKEQTIRCTITKEDLCFNIEYIISSINENLDNLKIEDILLKNIYFN